MHNAPAVSFPVGRSYFQTRFLLVAWLIGAAVCAYWASGMDVVGWRHGFAVAMPVIAGITAWLGWRHPTSGRLHWDGQCWQLETSAGLSTPSGEESPIGDLSLHLDLQGFLLLSMRFVNGPVQWLWLDHGPDPVLWQAFRRAVHANAAGQARESVPLMDAGTSTASADVAAPEPLRKARA